MSDRQFSGLILGLCGLAVLVALLAFPRVMLVLLIGLACFVSIGLSLAALGAAWIHRDRQDDDPEE